MDFDKLNDHLDTFVYGINPTKIEDIMFEDRLCHIALDNSFICLNQVFYDIKNCKYKNYIKKSVSKEISINFYNSLNPKYGNMLRQLFDSNMILPILSGVDDAYLDLNDGDKIYISFMNNIEDIFKICHEFMHYLNDRLEFDGDVPAYYTEALSSYIELVLCDYIKKNYPQYKKDCNKVKRDNIISLYQFAYISKPIIDLVKDKINGEYINYVHINNLLNNLYKDFDDRQIDNYLNETLNYIYDDTSSYPIRYMVAGLLSPYMKDNFKPKEIIELGNVIHDYEFYDVMDFLNLSFKDNSSSISEDKYDEIAKSYKKSIKGMW